MIEQVGPNAAPRFRLASPDDVSAGTPQPPDPKFIENAEFLQSSLFYKRTKKMYQRLSINRKISSTVSFEQTHWAFPCACTLALRAGRKRDKTQLVRSAQLLFDNSYLVLGPTARCRDRHRNHRSSRAGLYGGCPLQPVFVWAGSSDRYKHAAYRSRRKL